MSPLLSGVACPTALCTTFVTLRADCEDGARYDPVAKAWQFTCPECHNHFCATEAQLQLRNVTDDWLKRRRLKYAP
jgi:hypothetical protein